MKIRISQPLSEIMSRKVDALQVQFYNWKTNKNTVWDIDVSSRSDFLLQLCTILSSSMLCIWVACRNQS